MKIDIEKEAVQYLIESEPGKIWHQGEIAKTLGLHGKQLKRLAGILRDLQDSGIIEEKRRNMYRITPASTAVQGVIRMTRSGAGIVQSEEGKTYFVEAEDVAGAMPGDKVLLRLKVGRRDDPSGTVTKILETSNRSVVGTLMRVGKRWFVTPLSPVYKTDFEVESVGNAKENDRVVLRITGRNEEGRVARAEITDVIGPADQPSLDTLAVMRQYDLPEEFPGAVIREAETVAALVNEPGDRLDLREEFIITVDPERARDFDDAISLRIDAKGRRELGVHIADVSHFVRPDSALDREARERSTSVYFVDRVVPMLPEQLSNGVCSLQPNVDRLAFSAFITYDEKGHAVSRRFAKTRIRSKLRLTYEQAMALLTDKKPEGLDSWPEQTVPLLKQTNELAKQLRAARLSNGGLELESPETEIQLDKDGRMIGIHTAVNDESHQLIEACMVAANEAVATELTVKGIPVLSRLHEIPDEEKLAELTLALGELGFKPGDLSNPKIMSQFLRDTADHPLRYHVHTMVLRSLKRAIYSADEHGHFGLALTYYSHFTSPIRRYPDLVFHRQLADYLEKHGRGGKLPQEYLQRTAQIATERETVADEASRALIEIKKYRFLQQQLDEKNPVEYDAVIVKVKNFGLFVDVMDVQVSGMVHVSMIAPQFVRFNAANESLNVAGVSYTAGMTIKVKVFKLDFNNRRADFELVRDLTEKPSRERRSAKPSRERSGAGSLKKAESAPHPRGRQKARPATDPAQQPKRKSRRPRG